MKKAIISTATMMIVVLFVLAGSQQANGIDDRLAVGTEPSETAWIYHATVCTNSEDVAAEMARLSRLVGSRGFSMRVIRVNNCCKCDNANAPDFICTRILFQIESPDDVHSATNNDL
jgi:hypothetical protein